ncbi:MAG: hypothetical protein K6U74_21055, partial [Firmicutes bacterium]|nr:hypothetical protein [Bacillota bacterium]
AEIVHPEAYLAPLPGLEPDVGGVEIEPLGDLQTLDRKRGNRLGDQNDAELLGEILIELAAAAAVIAGAGPEGDAAREVVDTGPQPEGKAPQAVLPRLDRSPLAGVPYSPAGEPAVFLGHAAEMARASKVSLLIESQAVPVLPGALEFASMGLIPAGAYNNRRFLNNEVVFDVSVEQAVQDVLYDPQTSGGLLIAVDPAKAGIILKEMHKKGVREAVIVGKVIPASRHLIKVL